MLHSAGILAVCLYTVASIGFLRGLIKKRGVRVTFPAFWLGFLLHSFVLALLKIERGVFLPDSSADYFLWLSWLVALGFLCLRSLHGHALVGAFVAPLTSLLLVSSSLLFHHRYEAPPEEGRFDVALLVSHVLPALGAEVALILSLIVSAVYLILERRLKRKKVDPATLSAPSLYSLEQLNTRVVFGGFLLMTAAVLSGTVWAVSMSRPLLRGDYTEWGAFVTWFLLGLLMYLRSYRNWGPRRMSSVTVFSVAVFLLLYGAILMLTGEVHAPTAV